MSSKDIGMSIAELKQRYLSALYGGYFARSDVLKRTIDSVTGFTTVSKLSQA